ncbi:MAG TPA: tetratricopeptide repeat protein, partial [Caulobacteraceae bacterium]|nr:tetratricopeptide repeat protein [Caulobacteraceae bacterium]
MPFFGGGLLSLLISILLCVHVVRTNQPIYWILILLVVPVLGNLVYIVAVLAPELVGGTRARRFGMAAREAFDPTGEYRRARAAADEAPTVHNQMRLAAAAASLGRHAEAEALYAQAAQGIHADDPALLLGRANALIELGRAPEALPLLDKLVEEQGGARNPATVLAQARALEAVGRLGEADSAYQFAVGRLPGLEGLARYAAFLARTGRRQEAEDNLAEIDRRL